MATSERSADLKDVATGKNCAAHSGTGLEAFSGFDAASRHMGSGSVMRGQPRAGEGPAPPPS